jgi:hypothetical protein
MRSNKKTKKTQKTMKMTKFYAPLAALLLTGAAFTSCSSDDAKSEVVPANKNWSLSIEASTPGFDASTRALTWGGVNTSAISLWKLGETMEVYNITQGATYRGLLTPETGDVKTTNLITTSAGLTGSFAMNDILKIYYPKKAVTYMGQDGKFETISQKYDYSSISVTITDIDTENRALKATSSHGQGAQEFINVQALLRFTFTCNEEAVRASYVNIVGIDNNQQQALVQYQDPVTDEGVLGPIDIQLPAGQESDVVWAAIRANENATLTVQVTDVNGVQYTATTDRAVRLENSMIYEIPVTLHQVEAPTGGSGSN